MFKIGIYGNTCAGKSTVAKLLAEQAGIAVVSADDLADKILDANVKVISQVAAVFPEAIMRDGRLNRAKLNAIIDTNEEKREKLNTILLPVLRLAIVDMFNTYEKMGEKFLIYDAPLLLNREWVDYVAMVYVPYETQIKRVQAKYGFMRKEAERHIQDEQPIENSFGNLHDFLIRNTTSFTGLTSMVSVLWDDIRWACTHGA